MKLKKWNLPATEENMEWNSDLGVGALEIFLDKARTILENYNVASWAGFCGRDPNALDGYSMKFQAEFVDGSRIEASGENNFPKNFNEVFSELDDLTVEAKDAFYEK